MKDKFPPKTTTDELVDELDYCREYPWETGMEIDTVIGDTAYSEKDISSMQTEMNYTSYQNYIHRLPKGLVKKKSTISVVGFYYSIARSGFVDLQP